MNSQEFIEDVKDIIEQYDGVGMAPPVPNSVSLSTLFAALQHRRHHFRLPKSGRRYFFKSSYDLFVAAGDAGLKIVVIGKRTYIAL